MTRNKLAMLAVVVAGLLPAAAQAQSNNSAYTQPAPLAAYAMQPQTKPMAPKPHMGPPPSHMHNDHPQTHMHRYPSMRRTNMSMHMRRFERMHGRIDRRFVEDFRRHHRRHGSYVVDNTGIASTEYVRGNTEYVREQPVVIEHERYVDEPARVVEQHAVVEEQPVRTWCNRGLFVRCNGGHRAVAEYGGEYGSRRVINADAQITVIGPNRMSIELYRKGNGAIIGQ